MATEWDERLSPDDLHALLRAWDVTVHPDSPLANLPPPTAPTDVGALRARGLLDPHWGAALRALRRPNAGVRILVPWPREMYVQAYYPADAVTGALVGCWAEPPGIRIRFPVTTEQLLATVTDIVGAEHRAVDLTRVELAPGDVAALAAAVDVLRARYFEMMGERLGLELVTDLTHADLQRVLDMGRQGYDARWVVTMLRLLMPATAPMPAAIGDANLKALVRGGFLEPHGTRWRASDALCRLAAWLRTPLPTVALEAVSPPGETGQPYAHVVAIRGEGPIWTLELREEDGLPPRFAFGMTTLDALRQTVRSRSAMVATTPIPAARAGTGRASRVCASCGVPRRRGARFCHGCGAPFAVRETATTPS